MNSEKLRKAKVFIHERFLKGPEVEEGDLIYEDILNIETPPEDPREYSKWQRRASFGLWSAIIGAGVLSTTVLFWSESEIKKIEPSFIPTTELPRIYIGLPNSSASQQAAESNYPTPTTGTPNFEPISVKPNEKLVVDKWSLISGDVILMPKNGLDYIVTYDDLEETGQETVVPPGTLVTGLYGFTAYSIQRTKEAFDIEDNKIRKFINQTIDNKFEETITNSSGEYQLNEIRLSKLTTNGEIENITVFTRGDN